MEKNNSDVNNAFELVDQVRRCLICNAIMNPSGILIDPRKKYCSRKCNLRAFRARHKENRFHSIERMDSCEKPTEVQDGRN